MSTTGEASTSSKRLHLSTSSTETPELLAARGSSYQTLFINQISSRHIIFRLSPEDIALLPLLSKRALEICCSSTLFKDLIRCFFPYANVPFPREHERNREAVLVFIQLANRRRVDPDLLRVFINSRGNALYVGGHLRVQKQWPLPWTREKFVYVKRKKEDAVNSADDEFDSSSSSFSHSDDGERFRHIVQDFNDSSDDDFGGRRSSQELIKQRQRDAKRRKRDEEQLKKDEHHSESEAEDQHDNIPTTILEAGAYMDRFSSGGVYRMPIKFLNYDVERMRGFSDIRNDHFVCTGEGPGGSGMAFNVEKLSESFTFGPNFNKSEISKGFRYGWRFCEHAMVGRSLGDDDKSEDSQYSELNIATFDLKKLVKLEHGHEPKIMISAISAQVVMLSMDSEDKKLYIVCKHRVITVDMSDEDHYTQRTNFLANEVYQMQSDAFFSGPLYVDVGQTNDRVTTIDFRNINAEGKIVVHRYYTRPVPGRRAFTRYVAPLHYQTILLQYKQINGLHYPQFLSRPMPWEDRILEKHK
jgi:hypothetical protein